MAATAEREEGQDLEHAPLDGDAGPLMQEGEQC